LAVGQGELAISVEYNADTKDLGIAACAPLPSDPQPADIAATYLSLCDTDGPQLFQYFHTIDRASATPALKAQSYTILNARTPLAIYVGKKYKPVALKIRPVETELPSRFRITRKVIGDPLKDIPTLPHHPPQYTPTGRYTEERKAVIDKAHPGDFLLPEERALMHQFMCLQHEGFAWTDQERGHFREDFFPPIEIPTIPHKPWAQRNIPIPPGIYEEVCKVIRRKLDARVYEPSNSSYRSRWFCVVKKDGTSLRIVHSLEPLNQVTIKHTGVTPFTDQIGEHFAGRACGGMLDLYVGYDERGLAETSRDLTTFQTPYGTLRLVTLPMGWTNSVPIFHDDVTFILQPEIPDFTIPYIDDVPIRGPPSRYILPDGTEERTPENPGIRRFVWEHFQNVNRVVQRTKYCGGTYSGFKSTLCAEEIVAVGHRCTPQGRLPDPKYIDKISNWGPCKNVSEVRTFLGTIGICRMFILHFAKRANPLVMLTRKGVQFTFGEEQVAAQEDLKKALISSPALRPINYASDIPVILAVDTSFIAVGFYLCQEDENNARKRYFARFGSLALNDRERCFSQPKLELYGLFRALRAYKIFLVGVRNLIIEVDARYIRGMLNNPDIAPSASLNRWIVSILTFHFELRHVPGKLHGPDGLSRRPPQPGDLSDHDYGAEEFDDWVDNLYGFTYLLNPSNPESHSAILLCTFAMEQTQLPEDTADSERDDPPDNYKTVPRSDKASLANKRLEAAHDWLLSLERPGEMSDHEYILTIRYASGFFTDSTVLWKRDSQGAHKRVLYGNPRMETMIAAHNDIGHRGYFATHAILAERYWWPYMSQDLGWFIRTCHICQVRQTRQILIPPTVATPAPLFSKIYMDTMHLTRSGGFSYIVQGRCSLSHYPEFRMLRKETAQALADWIFQDIICRWGTIVEIVSDNGKPFVAALGYLEKKYHIKHIRISGYNSRANGIVERSHFDVRQALFKASDGIENKWSQAAHSVFWSERVTPCKRMGCSPYFAATGTHPLLPFDVVEANYLLPPPDSLLSCTDHIARRAIALQKRQQDLVKLKDRVHTARNHAALRFEREHAATIQDFDFKQGDLILMRNTAIEKALNRKMRPRYTGPMIVVSRNKGGAYILCELDGTMYHAPVAAFRVVPYFARTNIEIPDIEQQIDIPVERLRELEYSTSADPDDPDADRFEDVSEPDEHSDRDEDEGET
jgi:hypothetical protein